MSKGRLRRSESDGGASVAHKARTACCGAWGCWEGWRRSRGWGTGGKGRRVARLLWPPGTASTPAAAAAAPDWRSAPRRRLRWRSRRGGGLRPRRRRTRPTTTTTDPRRRWGRGRRASCSARRAPSRVRRNGDDSAPGWLEAFGAKSCRTGAVSWAMIFAVETYCWNIHEKCFVK